MSAMAIGGLSYEIEADDSELIAAAASADAALESMGDSMEDAADSARELEEATDDAEESLEKMDGSLREAKAAAQLSRVALKGFASEFPAMKQQIGMAAEGVGLLGKNMRVLTTVTGLTLGPILGVAAAIVAIGVAAVALHYAWRTNWNGMRDVVTKVAADVWARMKEAFDAVRRVVASFVKWAADGFAMLVTAAEGLAKMLGVNISKAADLGRDVAAWAKHLTTDEGFKQLIDDAKVTVDILKDGVTGAARGFSKELKIILDKFGISFGGGDKKGGGGSTAMDALTKSITDAVQSVEALAEASEDAAKALRADEAARASSGATAGAAAAAMEPVEEAMDDVANLFLSGGVKGAAAVGNASMMFANALKVGGSIVASKLGAVGEIISSAVQGFSSGGPWGAIIAVIAEVVTRLKGFQLVVDSLNNFLGRGLERINKAFGDTFQTITKLAESIGYVIEVIDDATGGFRMIGAILSIVGQTLSFLSIGILYAVTYIMGLIIDAGRALGANMSGMAKELQKMQIELVMQQAKHKEWNLFGKGDEATQAVAKEGRIRNEGIVTEATRNSAAIDENTESQKELTKAAKSAADALTNIPSGYKVATARFNALDAEIPHLASGGIVTAPTLALIGEAGPEAVVPLGEGMGGNIYIENAYFVTNDPADMRAKLSRDAFIKGGGGVPSAPPWSGG